MARRRSSATFNLGAGVRIRVGTKSSSISVGGKNGRVTVNSKGTRTTTLRAGGASVTTQSKKAKPKARVTPAQMGPTVVSPAMPLRRKTTDGYVSFNGQRLSIQRAVEGRFEVEPARVTSIEINRKDLVIVVDGQGPWAFKLRTWLAFKDLQFVNEVARAAGIAPR